jgi:HEAT repeat protein
MDLLTPILVIAALTAVVLWAAVSRHVWKVQRQREATRRLLAAAIDTLEQVNVRPLSPEQKSARLSPLLQDASRELVMSAAASHVADDVFAPLAHYLTGRWGQPALVADATKHRTARDKWRRIAALRILMRLEADGQPENGKSSRPKGRPLRTGVVVGAGLQAGPILDLVAAAVNDRDEDVAAAALALLGRSADERAGDLLIDALIRQPLPASRVAIHVEQSPLDLSDRLKTLLVHPDGNVRLWGATLLARYPDAAAEQGLVPLTSDDDPRVRKAAIQTLGRLRSDAAVACALRLLSDKHSYVRAHAARALGNLEYLESAEEVATLLGDADWWVRQAAKEALEAMGSDVWPVLMRSLSHSDRFIRNGAAEVMQNIGVLDSLIVMEAASDDPAPMKIAMLQRIADAGGVQFTDSLVERAGPVMGARIRGLLATIGMAHVEAH